MAHRLKPTQVGSAEIPDILSSDLKPISTGFRRWARKLISGRMWTQTQTWILTPSGF
jgi:hypothetical protein